jgi:hypothetical protein
MFNFFKKKPNPEDEEFENRIVKKCKKEFTDKKLKPILNDFEKLKPLGKGEYN